MGAISFAIRDAVIGRLAEFGAGETAVVEFEPEAALFIINDKTEAELRVAVIASGMTATSAGHDTDGKGFTIEVQVFKPLDVEDQDEQVPLLCELVEQILTFLRSDAATLNDPGEEAEWEAVEAWWDDEQPNDPVLYDQEFLRTTNCFSSVQSVVYRYFDARNGEAE